MNLYCEVDWQSLICRWKCALKIDYKLFQFSWYLFCDNDGKLCVCKMFSQITCPYFQMYLKCWHCLSSLVIIGYTIGKWTTRTWISPSCIISTAIKIFSFKKICLKAICSSLGGVSKNTYKLVNLWALKSSLLNKIHIFQYMGKIFYGELHAMWRRRVWSTLAEVMACYLMAPNHYLNQCYLLTSEVLWHSPQNNFAASAPATILYEFENYTSKITATPMINSLWPSDAIWRQRSGSTLAQVMACCLTAPSHYLNQCWLIIREVQWHSY